MSICGIHTDLPCRFLPIETRIAKIQRFPIQRNTVTRETDTVGE